MIEYIINSGIIIREDMDKDFSSEIAIIKANHTIPLADCCAIALSQRLHASIVTTDWQDMEQVHNNLCQVIFLRSKK